MPKKISKTEKPVKKNFFSEKNSFGEKIFSKEKSEVWKKTSSFLLFFLAIYVFIYYIVVGNFETQIILITKEISKFLLSFFYIITERGTFFLSGDLPISFSLLCTGAMEVSVLISAILASREINLKKRIIGAILAIPSVFVINQARIVLTVFSFSLFGLQGLDFAHNFFFRLSLFIIIVGYYTIWLFKVSGINIKKKQIKRKLA